MHAAHDAISIRRADLDDDDGRALIAALNAELHAAYPQPGANHFSLAAGQVDRGRGAFLIAAQGARAIGCGAVRVLEDGATAELKRMYVAPGARGLGVGRRLVEALEAEARALGAARLVLETGPRQAAALALYRACGFAPIPLFGEYRGTPETSVCLGKDLSPEPPAIAYKNEPA